LIVTPEMGAVPQQFKDRQFKDAQFKDPAPPGKVRAGRQFTHRFTLALQCCDHAAEING
jgi:hypothetical protein